MVILKFLGYIYHFGGFYCNFFHFWEILVISIWYFQYFRGSMVFLLFFKFHGSSSYKDERIPDPLKREKVGSFSWEGENIYNTRYTDIRTQVNLYLHNLFHTFFHNLFKKESAKIYWIPNFAFNTTWFVPIEVPQ